MREGKLLMRSVVAIPASLAFFALAHSASAQPRNADDYLFLMRDRAKVSAESVIGGNMAVNAPGGFLNVSRRGTMADGTCVVADNVQVNSGSRAFDVFGCHVFVGVSGVVAGTMTQPIPPPIYAPEPLVVPDPFDPANLPPDFPIDCGNTDRSGLPRETVSLSPGSYGTVQVGRGGKLLLGPGTYNLCILRAIHDADVVVTAPATINVRDQFRLGTASNFIPVGVANTIQVNVMGSVARLGHNSMFHGRLFAPNGTLRIGGNSVVMGHLVARQMISDKNIRAFVCGNGQLDAGEQCDTSAPNGDAACPGMCVPPGSPNECTCPPPNTTTTMPVSTTTSTSTTSTIESSTTTSSSTTTPSTSPVTNPSTTTTTQGAATTTTQGAATTTTTQGAATTTTTLAGCFTRTPGFWATHPAITQVVLGSGLPSCGLVVNNTKAFTPVSSTEDMCSVGTDPGANHTSPQQVQLIRQCMSAALNLAATAQAPHPGDCSSASPGITQMFDTCCTGPTSVCDSGASPAAIDASGCIGTLDRFNNLETTFDIGLNQGAAAPGACRDSKNNGFLNPGRNLGPAR